MKHFFALLLITSAVFWTVFPALLHADELDDLRARTAKGEPAAQQLLGQRYLEGKGVERDPKKAARFFRLAADQGYLLAQFDLGTLHEDGKGAEKNALQAYVQFSLALQHENREDVLGEAGVRVVTEKRDRVAEKLSKEQLEDAKKRIAAAGALIAVNPRTFGVPGGGNPTRGWYIWRKWDPATRAAEVSNESSGEVYKVRVLPWATTYRYLSYGASFDELLPGERINAFFLPDENHKRGYLTHFQDEICQMKGHGHVWEIRSVEDDGKRFTARALAGDKSLDDRVLTFDVHKDCRKWQDGKVVDSVSLKTGQKIYLTWVLREDHRQVLLLADDASLEKIKLDEQQKVAAQVAKEGLSGQFQTIDGDKVHFLVFSTYWAQAGQLKTGQTVKISAVNRELRPTGDTIEAKILSQANRGTYGSGVNDVMLRLKQPEDAGKVKKWLDEQVIRLLP